MFFRFLEVLLFSLASRGVLFLFVAGFPSPTAAKKKSTRKAGAADVSAKNPIDPCRDVHIEPKSRGFIKRPPPLQLVLVTGGSGFIGSTLVEMLLEAGYFVRVLDNLETGNFLYLDHSHPRLEFVVGDILNKHALNHAVWGPFGGMGSTSVAPGSGAPEDMPGRRDLTLVGIFHLAAASKVWPSLHDPAMATFNTENNALGTAILLEVIAVQTRIRGRRPIPKIIYAASSTFYGNADPPYHEDMPFSPTSPYAASKYMGEMQFQVFDKIHDIPSLNLRFFMVYGPRQPRTGGYAIVTGVFAELKKRGEQLTIEGSGEQFRDFVHVRDVARSMILGLQDQALRGGQVINIGSGTKKSVLDLAELVAPGEERFWQAARENDLRGTLADTCRAKRVLDFESWFDFDTEMKMVLDATVRGHDYTFHEEKFAAFFANEDAERKEEAERHPPPAHAPPFLWKDIGLAAKNARIREALHSGKLILAQVVPKRKDSFPGVEEGTRMEL